MDTNEQAAPTARLNFGQRVAGPAPVENTQTEAEQAEEAQQEAMNADVEAQPKATVEVEAEAETETSNADPVDAPEAPVETETEPTPFEDGGDAVASTEITKDTIPSADVQDEAEAINETMNELRVEPPAEPVEVNEPVEQEPVEAVMASPSGSSKSVEELTAERERLDAEIKEKQNAEKASVIAQIKTVVETYSITVEELVEALGGLKSKRKGIKAKPKYKDPATGVIWSGRGKEPAWIKGKNRDQFLIAE